MSLAEHDYASVVHREESSGGLKRRGAIKRRSQEGDAATVQRSKRGPKEKRPGVPRKKLTLWIYEDDFEEFQSYARHFGFTYSEMLPFMVAATKRLRQLEGQPEIIPAAVATRLSTSTQAADAEDNSGSTDDEEANASQEPLPKRRIPIYMRASTPDRMHPRKEDHRSQEDCFQTSPTFGSANPDGSDIDEEDPGPDVYEFIPEDEDHEGDAAQLFEAARAAFQTSLNVTDRCGRLLAVPSPTPEDDENQAAMIARAKDNDPRDYDYSDSPRLLPSGYYRQFSDGLRCRLHIAKKNPDPDWTGVVRGRTSVRHTKDAFEIAQDKRYIVELAELVKLISPKCYRSECPYLNDFSGNGLKIQRSGAVCIITIYCKGKTRHRKVWCSSKRLQHLLNDKCIYYAINTLLPSATILSGNHFKKIDLFFKVLNVRGISRSHFFNTQRFIVAPTVFYAYEKTQQLISEQLQKDEMQVVLGSDGQFDSVGKCATQCTVTSMIVATCKKLPDGSEETKKSAYIAAIDVIERRHTEFISTRMEVAGFMRSIVQTGIFLGMDIKEIVTDQNLAIVKLMKLAKDDPDSFVVATQKMLSSFEDACDRTYHVALCMLCANISHQLDIWHRAKNIGKALLKRAVPKRERENYYAWIQKIKNHFFWVSLNCDGNEMKFRAMWMSILHHCQGIHEWAFGHCEHDIPHVREDDDPEYLTPSSKSFQNIQTVIGDPKLLRDVPMFLKFRMTTAIESFNSMSLSYAPKRTYFSWPSMVVRKMLAVLDWNNSIHLPIQRDENQRPIYDVRYNKRAKKQTARARKAPNLHEHLPFLLARCLYEKNVTDVIFSSSADYSLEIQNDPQRLASHPSKANEDRDTVIQRHKRMTRLGRQFEERSAQSSDDETDDGSVQEGRDPEYEDEGSDDSED